MAAQQNQRNEALNFAAGRGDDAQVVSLLAQQADINWKNEYGLTPLHNAASNGHTSTCQLLIDNKADIDASDEYNNKTPIHRAAIKGHTSTCQLLIDHQANINACDQHGDTPLHLAAIYGHASTCQLLISNRADYAIRTVCAREERW